MLNPSMWGNDGWLACHACVFQSDMLEKSIFQEQTTT
jgi:hypothetical protein